MYFLGRACLRLSILSLSFSITPYKLLSQKVCVPLIVESATFVLSTHSSFTDSLKSHSKICNAPRFDELFYLPGQINSQIKHGIHVTDKDTPTSLYTGTIKNKGKLLSDTTLPTTAFLELNHKETYPCDSVVTQMAETHEDSGFVGGVDDAIADLTVLDSDSLKTQSDSKVQSLHMDSERTETDLQEKDSVLMEADSSLSMLESPTLDSENSKKESTVLQEPLLPEVTHLVEEEAAATKVRQITYCKDSAQSSVQKKARKSRNRNRRKRQDSDTTTEEKKSAKRKNKTEGDDEKETSEKEKPNFPTHFISIQINNPQIHQSMTDVQEAILKAEKRLDKAMVSVATAHLTLMVFQLETEEDTKRAGETLDKCVNDHFSNYAHGSEKLDFKVSGLGQFDHTVLFAKVAPGPELEEIKTIAKSIEECLAAENILKTDKREFKPHITLMKFSSNRGRSLRKQGIKKIDPSFYEEFLDKEFGRDTVTSVQLCSMIHPKNKDTGYYHIEHEIKFGNLESEKVDDCSEQVALVTDTKDQSFSTQEKTDQKLEEGDAVGGSQDEVAMVTESREQEK